MNDSRKKVWYFEVSVSVAGSKPDKVNKFAYGDKVHWVRKGSHRDSFVEAQADAIANGERPYRIKSEYIASK